MSNVKVTVYDYRIDGNGPATDLAYNYITWLLDILERIPLEWRAQVKIEHEAYESDATTSIYYWRPQTDAEIDAEKSLELKRKVHQRDQAFALIERLQADIFAEQARNES